MLPTEPWLLALSQDLRLAQSTATPGPPHRSQGALTVKLLQVHRARSP